MNSPEFLELKNLLLEQRAMLNMLIPSNATLSYVADTTGVSIKTISSYLKNNYTPIKDYEVKGKKTFLKKHAVIELLSKYNNS